MRRFFVHFIFIGIAQVIEICVHVSNWIIKGNEFSAFMVLASNFVLNGIFEDKFYQIVPWIDKYVECCTFPSLQ
jgi:hypothetical protein